jgi:hypothetical protein
MGTLSASMNISFEWISAPVAGFSAFSTGISRRFFEICKIPTHRTQSYKEWATEFSSILSGQQETGLNDLELSNCRASLDRIRRTSFVVRATCLLSAYMFAQSRIAFFECDKDRLLRRLDRVLLQLVVRMCVWRSRPVASESKWSCVRWMCAAQCASGRTPETLDALYKRLTNSRWDKLSDVFDEEVRGKKRRSKDDGEDC